MIKPRPFAQLQVAAVAVALASFLGGCSEQSVPAGVTQLSGSTTPSPQTLDVTGTLVLSGPNSASLNGQQGETCFGTGGYGDLKVGAQVAITGASGATVALGSVTRSSVEGVAGTPQRTCELYFSVNNVPRGKQFYEVKVAGRDGPQYPEEKLGLPLQLSIGS